MRTYDMARVSETCELLKSLENFVTGQCPFIEMGLVELSTLSTISNDTFENKYRDIFPSYKLANVLFTTKGIFPDYRSPLVHNPRAMIEFSAEPMLVLMNLST